MNYHKIEKYSIANGTGIRVVLWVAGCTCYCKGCQNPQTWSFKGGQLFDEKAKQELFEAINKPYIQGITFSGGHPLEKENRLTIYTLVKEIKEKLPSKDIWLYTGYKWEDIQDIQEIQKILCYVDVLVDGPYIDEQRDITLAFRGSKNQRIIDLQKTLQQGEVVLYEDIY